MARTSRCRVHQDRLWDASGQEWTSTLGQWAGPDGVTALLAASAPAVVYGLSRTFRTLSATEAAQFWSRVRFHFEVPGESGAERDEHGLTYAAKVWVKGQERLLGFVEFC